MIIFISFFVSMRLQYSVSCSIFNINNFFYKDIEFQNKLYYISYASILIILNVQNSTLLVIRSVLMIIKRISLLLFIQSTTSQ